MLENLTIILGVCFNSYVSSNCILKCHTGRDNQNDILIIKRKKNRYLYGIKKQCIYSRLDVYEYETFVPTNCVY